MTLRILFCFFVAALAAAAPSEDSCPKCEPSACPKDASACPYGLAANDPCDCCPHGVCGLPEGDKCFQKGLALPAHAVRYGACGENLECVLRPDLKPRDEPEAICVCKESQPACGSNNRTYDTVCQLNYEASRLGPGSNLRLKHLGPCASAPWVISGPTDVRSAMHTSLALDCEAKGYPTPSITWEFKSDDGSFKVLPSDDLYVAVQVRGGPEPFMATSWVQIVDLRPSDTGLYTCVASNTEGTARSSATVTAR